MGEHEAGAASWLPAGLRPEDLLGAGAPPSLERLETVLDGAAVLGLELDIRYRVLAATLEPDATRDPWPHRDDRRVQLLAFPVSTILASLRRRQPDGQVALLTFTEAQLVEVVAAIDAPRWRSPVFGRPEPRPGEWGPRFSLEGRSSAPDGTRSSLRLELGDDEVDLEVFARFDEVALKDPDGADLALPPG